MIYYEKNKKKVNMKIEKVKIEEVKLNKDNPRIIKDQKYKKLIKSIKEFPEMLEVRPIVVDDDMIVLGGNMRLKACKEAGLSDVYIIKFSNLSDEKKKEFIVKDNVGYGEWDWDMLNDENEWNKDLLEDWGLDIEDFIDNKSIGNYTRKIEAPIYEPSNDKPKYSDMYDMSKYDNLVSEIEESNISDDDKKFLKMAAARHIIFNFENIADFYAHSDKVVQKLMEDSALIIIDFNKAIELGFVKLSNDISNIFLEDYEK